MESYSQSYQSKCVKPPFLGDWRGYSELAKMPKLSNSYLFLYNSAQALSWAVAFFRILQDFLNTGSFNGAYASSGQLIIFLQKAAFLESIHGALGVVPSGVLFPLMQWAGRTHYLVAIAQKIEELHDSPSFFATFVPWCISDEVVCCSMDGAVCQAASFWSIYMRMLDELNLTASYDHGYSKSQIIRYAYYALNCVGHCPYWSTYLRYTAFIVLFPVGCIGEMWLMYDALPYIKEKQLYKDIFSKLPFSYPTFLQILLLCYPFLVGRLYVHLLIQRRSKLGKRPGKKSN